MDNKLCKKNIKLLEKNQVHRYVNKISLLAIETELKTR